MKFKPVNMDVLPLYIVLLLFFPPALFFLLLRPNFALAGSAVVYALAWKLDWNLPAYPNGVWFFNPFAWQLLFVFGAWCALGGAQRLAGVLRSRVLLAVAIAYLVFAFLITLTWHFESLDRFVPGWLANWMYPIDKTNLDVLRFAHFLALAAVTVRFIPRDWPGAAGAGSAAGDPLRPALPRNLLPRRVFGFCRAIHHCGIVRRPAAANRRQRIRHSHHDWYGEPAFMVQKHGRTQVRVARQNARRRPRGGRGMSFIFAVVTAIALVGGAAAAEPEPDCTVPDSLISSDVVLTRAAAEIKDQHRLDITVVGSGSSVLSGPDGARFAYPAQLEQALKDRLPGNEIKVTAHVQPRLTTADMASGLPQDSRGRQAGAGDLASRHGRRAARCRAGGFPHQPRSRARRDCNGESRGDPDEHAV